MGLLGPYLQAEIRVFSPDRSPSREFLFSFNELSVCTKGPLEDGFREVSFYRVSFTDFRVDGFFRVITRAGLTRARSLNPWVYLERNAVTHLPGLLPSCRVSCEYESVVSKKVERIKSKLSRERLLSEKTPRFQAPKFP